MTNNQWKTHQENDKSVKCIFQMNFFQNVRGWKQFVKSLNIRSFWMTQHVFPRKVLKEVLPFTWRSSLAWNFIAALQIVKPEWWRQKIAIKAREKWATKLRIHFLAGSSETLQTLLSRKISQKVIIVCFDKVDSTLPWHFHSRCERNRIFLSQMHVKCILRKTRRLWCSGLNSQNRERW